MGEITGKFHHNALKIKEELRRQNCVYGRMDRRTDGWTHYYSPPRLTSVDKKNIPPSTLPATAVLKIDYMKHNQKKAGSQFDGARRFRQCAQNMIVLSWTCVRGQFEEVPLVL